MAINVATDTVTKPSLAMRKHAGWSAAGLPSGRMRKFHCIRRTTASHYEAAGGNATELLKHASRKTTLLYLDPRVVHPTQAVDLLWRPKLDC